MTLTSIQVTSVKTSTNMRSTFNVTLRVTYFVRNMALPASTKRTRALRTSSTQYEELISYMESHSEFAAGKFLTKEGKVHHIKQWEELTMKLNALSSGTQKSTKQWQTVWRDMKSTASKKASKLRNERQRTGNFPVTTQPLSTMDQRVIACMGLDYVQGSVNVPDSTPEQEDYQIRLERGETEVLDYTPATASIEDDIFVDSYVPPTIEENERMEREDAVDDALDFNDVINACRQRNVEDISAAEDNVEPISQIVPAPHQRRAEENQRNRRQRSGVQQLTVTAFATLTYLTIYVFAGFSAHPLSVKLQPHLEYKYLVLRDKKKYITCLRV